MTFYQEIICDNPQFMINEFEEICSYVHRFIPFFNKMVIKVQNKAMLHRLKSHLGTVEGLEIVWLGDYVVT